jgi:hypothetical protein
MNGEKLSTSTSEIHLGSIFGNVNMKEQVDVVCQDFYRRVNNLLYKFRFCDSQTLYKLFKSYCMSLYGANLWNLESKHVETFYIAWRKCVRRIFKVPYQTHNELLPGICNDMKIELQLLKRSAKFIESCLKSESQIVNTCIYLALAGTNSNISDTAIMICHLSKSSKNSIIQKGKMCIDKVNYLKTNNPKAKIIRELCSTRDGLYDIANLSKIEITEIINMLCIE